MKKRIAIVLLLSLLIGIFSSNGNQVFASGDTWVTKANMPSARYGHAVATHNGKIYAIGGEDNLSKVEEYDPSLNTWSTKANMPTGRKGVAGVTFDGKIYVVGGELSNGAETGIVQEYDPATNTWTNKASRPIAARGLALAVANNKIYAIGGYLGGSNGFTDAVHEYNPTTNSWTTKTNAPFSQSNIWAATINNKIYVSFADSATENVLFEYNPATDTWTQKADPPTYRYNVSLATVNDKLYAIGGNDSGVTGRVEEYNPITDSWTTRTSMSVARMMVGTATVNNKIYAIGGAASSPLNRSEVEEYTPPVQPDIPSNLTASPGNAQVNLEWDIADGADTYTIKRATTEGGPYTEIETGVTDTNYSDTDVVNGTTYYYIVTAVSTGGESDPSNEATATPQEDVPLNPTDLTAVGGDSQVDLSWTAADDAVNYIVKRSTSEGGPYSTVTSDVYGTTYTDTDVVNGTTYYYVVTAVNAGGESDPSNETSATPMAPEPEVETRALLTIYLIGGQVKEYDLLAVELEAFLDWFDDRAAGTGPARFGFEKTWNAGPFTSRTEYVIFDKIETFDVDEYEIVPE